MHRQTQTTYVVRGIYCISLLLLFFVSCTFEADESAYTEPIQIDPYESWSQEIDSLIAIGEYKRAKNLLLTFYHDEGQALSTRANELVRLYQVLSYEGKEDSSEQIFDVIEGLAAQQLEEEEAGNLLVKAYLSKAKILQDADNFKDSEQYLQRAKKLNQGALNDPYAYCLILQIKAAYYEYNYALANQFMLEAHVLFESDEVSIENKNLLDNWSSILQELEGEYEKSMEKNHAILSRLNSKQVKSKKEEDLLSYTYQNLGAILSIKRDLKKASNFYLRALEVEKNKSTPDPVNMSVLLNNIAFNLMNRQEFEQAILKLRENQRLQEGFVSDISSQRTQIETLLHLAYCYRELGQNDSVLSLSRSALNLQKKVKADLDYSYFMQAAGYFNTEKYEEALEAINLSIRYAHENYGERHRLLGRSYSLKGRILEKLGQFREALGVFQQSLISLSRSFSSNDFRQNPNLISLYSEVDGLRILEYKNRVLLKLHENYPQRSEYLKAAEESNQLALDLISQLRKTYSDDFSKLQLLSKANPIFDMGLKIASLKKQESKDSSLLSHAFKISEQGKSMILQDHMRSAFALQSPDIPPEMKRKEDSLRLNINFYGRRVEIFKNRAKLSAFDSTQFQTSQRIYLESEDAYEKLLEFFDQNYEEYANRKKATDSVDLAKVFDYLKENDLSLIEFFEGEDLLYVFHLHQGKIKMLSIALTEELREDILNFKEKVSNAREVYNRGNSPQALEEYANLAFKIYQKILSPVLQDVQTDQDLVIIPDGILNVFPFEALIHRQESTYQSFDQLAYLIRERQIHYALSANLLLDEYKRKAATYDFLGYAPQYEGSQSLDFNEAEVKQIAKIISGKAMTGEEANKKHFLQFAGQGKFLHLAQHAIKEEDPMMSHLLFSRDGSKETEKLFAYEVYNQNIPCELAVLNACETGQGKLAQGEGMLSLSRAFRYAGAASVIMNGWAVNDESSFRILSNFYQKLTQGQETAEALRNAKLTYLKASNKTHPYFWAGASLIGVSSQPNFQLKEQEAEIPADSGISTSWIFLMLALLFLLGLIFHLSKLVYPSMKD